ncbi:MAG: hypothetical protein AB7I38_18665 [Dehalococcoidia bacterium]
MDNISVDTRRPAREELDRLVASRIAHPKVQAQELAEELGVTPSQLSAFENDRAVLPHNMGARSYEAALTRCKARKGAEVAA